MTDYEPAAGDLIWTDFDPRTGREQGGRRPALVIPAAILAEVRAKLAVLTGIHG